MGTCQLSGERDADGHKGCNGDGDCHQGYDFNGDGSVTTVKKNALPANVYQKAFVQRMMSVTSPIRMLKRQCDSPIILLEGLPPLGLVEMKKKIPMDGARPVWRAALLLYQHRLTHVWMVLTE